MKTLFCFLLLPMLLSAQNPVKYTKIPGGYMMVLERGDDILKEISNLAEAEKIPSASFSGFGFVNMEFGFFDFEKKKYEPRKFEGVELASMTGSIGWQKGKPSIHAHGLVSGPDFQAYGGHILNGTVGTGTLEVIIRVNDKKFERVFDTQKGHNVLCLENCPDGK